MEHAMDAIVLSVEIGEDRHLVIDLPPEMPIGTAQITIRPQEPQQITSVVNPAREAARAKMLAAGILSTAHQAPEGTIELTPEARERVWDQFSGDQSIDDLINEDRGE
jgi:hypothetical protein